MVERASQAGLIEPAPGQVFVYCARCSSRRLVETPLALVEPDRTKRAAINWAAEDWNELGTWEQVEPHLEVWLVRRRGRKMAGLRGVASTSGEIRDSPMLRRRLRGARRTYLELAPMGSMYELRCRHCGARPRISAQFLREQARTVAHTASPYLYLRPDGGT